MKKIWKEKAGKYTKGENCFVGRIPVGYVFYSGTVGRNDPNKIRVSITLPGIESPSDGFSDIDVAKACVELAVDKWFKWVEEAK